jgi:malate dehydrogenase
VQFTPEEKAAFDKSCAAVKNLIDDFKKLGV